MTEAFDPFGLNDDDALDRRYDDDTPMAGTTAVAGSVSATRPIPSPPSAPAPAPAPFLPRSVSLSSSNADWTIEPPPQHPQQMQMQPSGVPPPSSSTSAFPATTEDWALFDPFGLASSRSGSSSTVLRKGSISPPPQVSRVNRATPSPPSPATGGVVSRSGSSGGGGDSGGGDVASPFSAAVAQPSVGTTSHATSSSFVTFPFGQAETTASGSRLQAVAGGLTTTTMMLPPKMVVKISVHEEVSSVARAGGGAAAEGTSDVAVEGTILAQVQCSDAKKNAPFVLASALPPPASSSSFQREPQRRGIHPEASFSFLPDNRLSSPSESSADASTTGALIVKVPKEEIGYVPVGTYLVTEQVPHMPILLERKVTIQGTLVRIAVQVRSKLTNAGSMEDFTIAVAFPEHVDGRTVRVLRGDGAWDDLKRIVKWRLDALHRGDSYMVTAQAALWKPAEPETEIHFPVLLRCTATSDQVSTVALEVRPADGHPASLTASVTTSSRILHRLT